MIKATLIPLTGPRPSDGPACDPATCVVPGCGHDGRDPRDHGVACSTPWPRPADAAGRRRASRVARRHAAPDAHAGLSSGSVDPPAVAVTEPANSSPPPQYAASAATPRSSPPSSAATPRSSTSAGTHASPPAAIWKALVARDAALPLRPDAPGHRLMCHADHVTHWVDGGRPRRTTCCCSAATSSASIHPGRGRSEWQPRGSSSFSRRAPRPALPIETATTSSPAGYRRLERRAQRAAAESPTDREAADLCRDPPGPGSRAARTARWRGRGRRRGSPRRAARGPRRSEQPSLEQLGLAEAATSGSRSPRGRAPARRGAGPCRARAPPR